MVGSGLVGLGRVAGLVYDDGVVETSRGDYGPGVHEPVRSPEYSVTSIVNRLTIVAPSPQIVSDVSLGIFTFEVIVKVLAEGTQPSKYFTNPYEGAFNTFDFLIVVLSWTYVNSSVCTTTRHHMPPPAITTNTTNTNTIYTTTTSNR